MVESDVYELVLSKIPKERAVLNESMKKHTSFKIGGNADLFVRVIDVDEIKFILEICKKYDIPLTVIGNGSNVLVKDNGIEGVVLRIDIDGIKIEKFEEFRDENNNIRYLIDGDMSSDNFVVATVGAGVLNGKLAQILLKKCIAGFEFASGIPGTIGGAIKMNAGAYGSEFKDIVIETTCMNSDGEIFVLNNSEHMFEYRKSIFKEKKYIILECKLLLKQEENDYNIKLKMDEYKVSRIEKQPIENPSAGSTFKRGADFITAKIIDECGLKGLSVGDAKVSEKHAGFVVNTGNATAEDVLRLIDIIKSTVFEKCGKNIELEIEILGK